MCQAFSSLADIGGDGASSTDVQAVELDADSVEAYAEFDDTMLMSVNDDLSDYAEMPIICVDCYDLPVNFSYANRVNNLSGSNPIYFHFNPYILNSYPYYENLDMEIVLTFADGYSKDLIYPISSSDKITGMSGLTIESYNRSGSSISRVYPSGFRYVDDNTIRLSFTDHVLKGQFVSRFSQLIEVQVPASVISKNNSVSCRIYYKLSDPVAHSSVALDGTGGGGSGGSGSGGGSGTAT